MLSADGRRVKGHTALAARSLLARRVDESLLWFHVWFVWGYFVCGLLFVAVPSLSRTPRSARRRLMSLNSIRALSVRDPTSQKLVLIWKTRLARSAPSARTVAARVGCT